MSARTHAGDAAPAAADPSLVAGFITLVACAASVVLALTAGGAWHSVAERPGAFATFAVLTLVLSVIVVDVYGRGAVNFSGMALLATGMMFGVGPAAAIGVACGVVLL